MADPFVPKDLHTLADFLLVEGEEDDPDADWCDIEDARCRAAVNRAYYAVFHALLGRMKVARASMPPARDGHLFLRVATRESLGDDHPVADVIKTLWKWRKWADYERSRDVRHSDAVDRRDDCEAVLEEIEKLTVEELRDIGREMVAFAATR